MAGHSKWSKVKHIKGVLDARRGKAFSKLAKEITVAARLGGGDPSMNPRLRSAIAAARAQNMPNDNIDRAIKRGTGELGGDALEEILYEGYAPGGVAILVEAASDNRNRTAADLRNLFAKNHGTLASSGSVSYLFSRKGQILIPKSQTDEDRLLEIILDAGAEELASEADHFVVTTPPDKLYPVAESLKQQGITPDSQKLAYIPSTTVHLDDESIASQVLRLCDALEDCDDVQQVYANFDAPELLLAKLSN